MNKMRSAKVRKDLKVQNEEKSTKMVRSCSVNGRKQDRESQVMTREKRITGRPKRTWNNEMNDIVRRIGMN